MQMDGRCSKINIQLINKPNPNLNTLEQILFNRGFSLEEAKEYVNLTDKDILEPAGLGVQNLTKAAATINKTVYENKKAIIIVDCDCDGYTSAALLVNYLYKVYPCWAENNLDWLLHDSKQHGLRDHMEKLILANYDLILCPDSSSNDYECHKKLKDKGSTVIVLDHHLADKISEDAIVINNQLSDYSNKELSGVGVVWQFCRFFDSLVSSNYANNYLDLVALGLSGDMMSLKSFETKYLITKGFKKENIKNPFIEYMLDKNAFPLSKPDYKSTYIEQACTNMGAAFFIVPFVNAITRSGTTEEKSLIFKSMLEPFAFTKIDEIKRNKKTGKKENLVLQAMRVVTNVKNRQTKAEQKGLEKLETLIKQNNMLQHKILLFILEPSEIEPEIRGLIANKLMAKYQCPCIIASENGDEAIGSMRGYTKNGLASFKELLEKCPQVNWVQGHDNAAGISLKKDYYNDFLNTVDELMKDISSEPLYRVDYLFKEDNLDPQVILDIASYNDFWGQDVDRSYIGIRFKVTSSNFSVLKASTLKIELKNNISLIKFGGSVKDIENFTTKGWIEIEAYCKCSINEWNGRKYPQLMIEDYSIIDSCKYNF
jgi:single-stranded-DNA-specific exonuclease